RTGGLSKAADAIHVKVGQVPAERAHVPAVAAPTDAGAVVTARADVEQEPRYVLSASGGAAAVRDREDLHLGRGRVLVALRRGDVARHEADLAHAEAELRGGGLLLDVV